jgi:hypothetical protein
MQSNDNSQTESGLGLLGFLDEAQKSDIDDAQHQQITRAQEAFRDVEKLMKTISLYGRDHQSTDRFIDQTFSSLSATIQGCDSLEVDVHPYELSVHGEPILQNPSPDRNFIYTLYLDGIRRLSFRRELTRDELARFVDILLTDWEEQHLFEDDMVTMLWSGRFAGLKYSVLDNFAEDIRDGDENVYTVAGVIEHVRRKGEFLASTQPAVASDHASRRLKRIDLSQATLTDQDLQEFSEVFFEMDEVEFRHLRTVVHTTAREKLEKFIEILFKVHLIQEVSEEARRGRITALFDRIADLLLDSGAIGELERLLRTIRRLTGPSDQVIRENVLAIEHIVDHWSAQPFIDRVTIGLRMPDFKYRPSVIAICELLSRRAAPHIARVAGRVAQPETRGLLWGLVADKLSGQERAVAELLATADRQHSHEILNLLKQTVDPDELKFAIETALRNTDSSVRLEALTNIPIQSIERFQNILTRSLKDRSKSVRSRVLHLLARVKTDGVHNRILACIDGREFTEYELDEKRRFYAAAALTGQDSERWSEEFNSNVLLSTKAQDAIRHCAAIALGIQLRRDALHLLEREAKRRLKYPLAAEAAIWAMRHMECSREERTSQLYALFYHGELTGGLGSSNV